MRRAGDDADRAALERLGIDVSRRVILARHKARRDLEIRRRDEKALAKFRGDRNCRRGHVAVLLGEGIEDGLEAAHLHGARDGKPLAGGARQLDGKSRRQSVDADEVQGRKLVVDEEPDRPQPRKIGSLEAGPRIPEIWDGDPIGGRGAGQDEGEHGDRGEGRDAPLDLSPQTNG